MWENMILLFMLICLDTGQLLQTTVFQFGGVHLLLCHPLPPVGVWSIAMSLSKRLVCLSVYLSVCPSPRVAQTPDVQMSTNFLYMLPVAVARSSSGGNAICYVLPVCGWRHIMEQICQNQRLRMFCPVCQVAAPGTKSAVFDCILLQPT